MKKIITAALCTTWLLSACVNKEFFDSMNQGGNEQKPSEEYFDFKTTSEVSLVINYGFQNYVVPFELYLENPYDETGNKIESILPFYGAFTDANSSFSGTVKLPAHIETVYICSDYVGIPPLLELEIEANTVSYLYEAAPASRSVSYEGDCLSIGDAKMVIDTSKGLYAIYNQFTPTTGGNSSGGPSGGHGGGSNSNRKYFIPSNSANSGIYTEVPNDTQLTEESTLGQLLTRISSTLTKKDNTFYCSDSKTTNLRIAKWSEAGNEIESAHIDLVYISASGGYHNAMGYYYYKSDETLTAAQIKALPKFMVFPRTTSGKPGHRIKARLQYFGENYTQSGVDHFPPGYTIGWILVPDMGGSLKEDAALSAINSNISTTYSTRTVYSNQECNINDNQGYGCVTLWDAASQKVVIGFEDQAFGGNCGDKSYEDILFYVDCDPIEAIYDPSRPETEEKPDEEIERTIYRNSTLAFEDIWPSGGDYDMNDVVIEYTQSFTYNNQNLIKRIEDSFKPVHSGATLKNGFGFIFTESAAQIVEEESSYLVKEESNQYMMIESVKESIGKEYKLVRTFDDLAIDKDSYDETINPFIVPSYVMGEKSRAEVHLPKASPSPWANLDLVGTGSDAYYMDVDGKYPFAIELVGVKDWTVVTETKRIGSEGEYPLFNSWVESKGELHTDWYTKKE